MTAHAEIPTGFLLHRQILHRGDITSKFRSGDSKNFKFGKLLVKSQEENVKVIGANIKISQLVLDLKRLTVDLLVLIQGSLKTLYTKFQTFPKIGSILKSFQYEK